MSTPSESPQARWLTSNTAERFGIDAGIPSSRSQTAETMPAALTRPNSWMDWMGLTPFERKPTAVVNVVARV